MLDNATISTIIASQNQFFQTGATHPYAFRLAQLKRLKELVIQYDEQILAALATDLGRAPYESYMADTIVVLDELNTAIKNLKKWMKPSKVSTPMQLFPASSKVAYEPLGVALIIAPWNVPFHLAIAPLVGAIAAGNCAIIKPSELAPASSKLIAEIINNHFDKQYLHVIEGGPEVASEILEHRFEFVFFTGGVNGAREVYTKAAKHLTPVALELGGKNACIVHSDADLKVAAKRIAWGKFLNAGQTCLAPDYLLVHQSVWSTFLPFLQQTLQMFAADGPSGYTRIINRQHFDRLKSMIPLGKVVHGGELNEAELIILPTLLEDVPTDSKLMQEEIFGPLLPVYHYNHIEEALAFINQHPKPLALYAFTKTKGIKQQVLACTSSGAVLFNDCMMHGANGNLPFGGTGLSGFGRYHHQHSFWLFSNAKGVMDTATWLDPAFRYPPYKGKSLDFLRKVSQ
jgi:acyl-CoA reductase-like NAD-dependent aldehyde dehydrogenase